MTKLKENIAISESGFLFDPNSGESFSLNATGKEIANLLAKDTSENEIEAYFTDKYEISSIDFQRNLEDFYNLLRRYNLIEL